MTLRDFQTTVLAHLSDVHLPPPSPLPSWRHFLNKRALSVVSWKRHRMHRHLPALTKAIETDMARHAPDLILNTGDLTNFGLAREFDAAASWLATMPAPCLVVPGNHDAMVSAPWETHAGQWGPWMEETDESHFPYCHVRDNIAVIGVNSAIPTPPFMACGRVGKAQRERLAAVLDATRHLCRIVMIHHPPRTGLVKWRKSLLDQRGVAETIARHGAALVLHGHSHDATLSTIRNTSIPLLGVASASLSSSRPWRQSGWNRIAVSRREEGWDIDLTTRQYTLDEGWRCTRRRNWVIRDEQH
ncbi:metallophosphoesterase family protein [Asaia krungthepensis]|uniref:Metallophosphoesterase n=1 Tax=Asaia krungthepensis NRIC 0535 TaxID=1307925 RepID=A0ABQ0PY41_9PROT|nr:metallophosphoesterase [Asaia krungthepensis]GBQ84458.1 metallophosphoesterase [Asaia krungthepensis NRIC 0535]